MDQQSIKNKRNKYKVIDQQKRLQIIDRIINKRQQLKVVSQEIGINVSTCKAIIKVYQSQGRVGKKKTRNKVIEVVQTYSFYVLENANLTQLCPLQIKNSTVSVQNKQMVQDKIQQQCKQKALKLLNQAVETYKKVQEAKKQTQLNTSNLLFNSQTSFYNLGFFPQ